jgi:four helix bundle protein
MASPTSFRDIRAWQTAMQLAVDIYHLTGDLPATEKPGLSTSLQKAATAIPSWIASGHKTGSRSGFRSSCLEAVDAATELETLLIITGQLYPNIPSNDLLDQLDEVQQMLEALIKRLSQTKPAPRKTV